MKLEGRIGVFGGTFDPIHNGHLDAAEAARLACGLDTVLLVPARVPPHRSASPQASDYDRFAMAALAADRRDGLVPCDIELHSAGPSFTALTLDRLTKVGVVPTRLFFITGADAFAEIATWHDYPAVLDRGHFVVVSRPGHPAEALRNHLSELQPRMCIPATLKNTSDPPVSIWLVDAMTREVSSSAIRSRLTEGVSIDGLVPSAVAHYITKHTLYVTSTAARRLHE